jgi:hypothetical protein
LEANRAGTVRTNGAVQQPGKLHKEPSSQYADTHAGSKMDTIGDRGAGVSSTVHGDKLVNTNHHHSNFEAANVTKDTTPATDASPDSSKKRSSLLDRLKPNRD